MLPRRLTPYAVLSDELARVLSSYTTVKHTLQVSFIAAMLLRRARSHTVLTLELS